MVKEILNPNGKWAKMVEVLFQIIRVTKSGVGPGATSRWSRGWDTSCRGLAGRRRCTWQNGGHRRGSQAEVLHWKGRFPRDIEFDLGEELVEIRNRDVDRRIPLSPEPHHPPQLKKARDEGGHHGTILHIPHLDRLELDLMRAEYSRRKVPNATVQG
jgi:hypothetical protein